jgi:WD40 repeat protein
MSSRFPGKVIFLITVTIAVSLFSNSVSAGDSRIREIQRLLWALDYGAARLDGVDSPAMRTRASKFLTARGKPPSIGDDQLLEELKAAFDQKKQELEKPANNPEIVDRHGIADYNPQMFVSVEDDLVLAGVCPIYRFKLSNSAPLRVNRSCAQYNPFVYSRTTGTIAAGSRWEGEVYGLVVSDAKSGLRTDFIEIPDNLFSEKMVIHPNGLDVLVMTWENVWRVNLLSRTAVKITSMPKVVLEGAAISPDGRFFATEWSVKNGSNFIKKLSVWDWLTGKKISESASRGMAFSNDGSLIALGSDNSGVEIRETVSGRVVAKGHFEYSTMPNFTYSDSSVAFAANNESLLYLDNDGKLLREWNFKTNANLDRVKLASKANRGVLAPASGKLYTLEGDRVLTYDLAGGGPAERKTLSPLSVVEGAISPDKTKIAVAGADSIALADISTGAVKSVSVPGLTDISSISFPQTSDRLLIGNSQGEVFSLDLKSGRRESVIATNKSQIKALVSARGRSLAAVGTGEKIIVFDPVSGKIQTQVSCECSYITNNNVAFVDNDQRLLFMDKFRAVALDIATGRRVMDYEMKSNVKRVGTNTTWNHSHMGFIVPKSSASQEYWVGGDGVGPKILYEYSNGKLLARRGSPEGTFSFFPAGASAADIFDDGALAVGLYKTPRISNPDADQYLWTGLDFNDSALVVGTLTNGRFVVLDKSGEIRIYSRSQTMPLVRTLLYADGNWLSRTDSGFFSGTRPAAENLFLALGNGVSVSLDNLFNALYRPDLVIEASIGDPDGKVKAAAAKLDLEKVMASGSAPKLAITSPAAGASSATDEVAVEATVSDQGGGIGKVEWRVNGVTSGIEARGLDRVEAAASIGRTLTVKRSLALERGENRIEVLAYNSKDLIASEPASVTVTWNGEKTATPPKLFVMAVGVNDYYDGRLKLSYAVPDATAIAEGFRKAGTGLYANVDVTTVLDSDVTVANLDKVFSDLGVKVQPRDVFVFFLAGHGKTRNGRYYFLPRDFRYEDEDSIEKAGMDQDKFQAWFAMIAARKSILLYDTCESGSLTGAKARGSDIDERLGALNRMTRATGRTFLTATTDDAPALEGYHGHGVFTYAILDALNRGDVNKNGLIEVSELADYVDQMVPDISFDAFKLRQIPQRSIVGNNFALTNKAEVLTVVAAGNTGPASPTSAVVAPTKPTHVVIAPVAVKVAIGDASATIAQLPPGTQVRIVEAAGEWVLISREGKNLGYVQSSSLLVLQ